MNVNAENNFDFTEAVFNKLAELYLSSQIKKSDSLAINIDSTPEKIVKGEVDSLHLSGKKIVAFQNITLEEVNFKSEAIALNVVEIISGKLVLERPSKFGGKIILNTADCDRLLNSKYLNTLLKRLPIEINENLFTFDLQHAKCQLKESGKLTLVAELILNSVPLSASSQIGDPQNSKNIETNTAEFEIKLLVKDSGKNIVFEGGKYRKHRVLPLEATIAILSKIRDLLYFRHFTSPNFSFEIKAIEIIREQLIIGVDATVTQLPNSLESPLKIAALEIN